MNYEKIKEDVIKYSQIINEEKLSTYCIMNSLLMELCLKDKGIEASVVKGYIVIDDEYWVLHFWNKIDIKGRAIQLDTYPLISELRLSGKSIIHSTILKDKWRTFIDSEMESLSYELVSRHYKYYKENGANWWFDFVKETSLLAGGKTAWMNFVNKVKRLEAFERIENYLNFG